MTHRVRGLALRLWPALLIALTLGGCAADAGLHASVKPLMPAADALAQTIGTPGNGAWPAPDWVKQYHDPQLDELVTEALRHNPDLQIAKARIGVAQSQLEQFASLAGVTGTAGASVSRTRLPQSDELANITAEGQQIPVQLFSNSTVSPSTLFAGLNYQLDLWGKNAALTRGLLSTRDAARIDAEQARLTLTVGLVTLYFELDSAFEMRDILNEKRSASNQIDAVLRERAARGLDNGVDVDDAQIKQSQLQAQSELNDERITLTQLQLGVLTGHSPDRGLSIHRPQLANADDTALPARLPVDLMGRRPDIVAARLRAEAAMANVDATRAEFYPDVNLVGFAGLTALTPASLFSRSALIGSIGPAISLPVFDRARLRAQLGGDFAKVDAAVSLYNKTIDDALGEVARQITSLRTVDTLAREQTEAVEAAARIMSAVQERHRRGIATEKDVMLADLSLLDQQAHQVDLQTQRRVVQVALIGALGGGFDQRKVTAPPIVDLQSAFPSQSRLTHSHFD